MSDKNNTVKLYFFEYTNDHVLTIAATSLQDALQTALEAGFDIEERLKSIRVGQNVDAISPAILGESAKKAAQS